MSTAISTVNSQITDAILPTNWVAPRKPPYRDVKNNLFFCIFDANVKLTNTT